MSLTRIFLHAALCAAVAGALACGSGTSAVQASIGPSGGSLSMENPAVRFDVPAGALTKETMVSLRASADQQSLLVTLEPGQLTLAKPGQLSVSMAGTRHISGVTEVTTLGERPIGVDARVEDASGARAQLSLDHLTRVRLSTADLPDGGVVPGACREHDADDDDHDGEHEGPGDGGHHDGEHDGGMLCPVGFECDDGVCVAHGGNHEHDDDCRGMDGGACPDDDDHDGEHRDGGHDDDHRDGGHD